jgi:hypothetical protein
MTSQFGKIQFTDTYVYMYRCKGKWTAAISGDQFDKQPVLLNPLYDPLQIFNINTVRFT